MGFNVSTITPQESEDHMIEEKQLKQIFRELVDHEWVQMTLDGTPVTIKIFDNASKLMLAAPVYIGSNYIPKSVRKSLSEKVPFDQHKIRTYMHVIEEEYQVILHYLGRIEDLDRRRFHILLEEFCNLAEEWTRHLDNNDRNDLVHVRVPNP